MQLEQALERAKKSNEAPETIDAIEQQELFYKQQFALLNDPQFSLSNPPQGFALPQASWWYDLRNYVPADLIKKQEIPMFVVQGGKDIQVPVSDYEQLKGELKERTNVQYKLYPNMFHGLANWEGEPNGTTEYMTPGIVPQELITDISNWMKKGEVTETPLIDPTVFTDYKEGLYWSEAIKWALNKGLVVGFSDEKKLKPDLTITESQYLRIMLCYSNDHSQKEESIKSLYEFAKEKGLKVSGKSNVNLTRGQAAVLLTKTFAKQNFTEKQAVQWLFDQGVINGYDQSHSYESFKPTMAISRAHLVTILYNLEQKK
ncbi:S-layer homology domain-containing protein [Bacillus massiliigorillae]|uniref:S-layer homology domain-containing protein n=1 Tax=Bacillus massiliigorillae TaxID=1243664 RepID=UPI0003AA90F0|nr:S-layer homology domain-containing protein [Bacillus massiliigorillae]